MVQTQREVIAQYFYLAQLEAQKGACQCKTCQLLRKGNDVAVNQALQTPDKDALTAEATKLAATGFNPADDVGS